MDGFEGMNEDPLSLHKFLYCNNEPVLLSDPSGHGSLFEKSITLGIQTIIRARLAIGLGFAVGARQGGQALRALGIAVERTVAGLLKAGGATVDAGIKVFGPGGSRVIDFVAKAGQRVAWIEVKYKLPSRGGDSLTRLAGQMQSGSASATGGQQMVLFTFKEPTIAEMELVLNAIGPTKNPIQFVSGFQGLMNWMAMYFF